MKNKLSSGQFERAFWGAWITIISLIFLLVLNPEASKQDNILVVIYTMIGISIGVIIFSIGASSALRASEINEASEEKEKSLLKLPKSEKIKYKRSKGIISKKVNPYSA